MTIILQILHADDTAKTEDAKFIDLCQVNSSIHSLSQKKCYFIRIYFMYNKSPYNLAHLHHTLKLNYGLQACFLN